MSMPSFPDTGKDITKEQALNMILASIAMEELSLSHIMNAEGEKLQYILGTLEGQNGKCSTTKDILDVNKSIHCILDTIMQNQIILKGKMERVLEEYEPFHVPCEPDGNSMGKEKSCLVVTNAYPKYFWQNGCGLPWQFCSSVGEGLSFNHREPQLINLQPGRSYRISFFIEAVLCPCIGEIQILLQTAVQECPYVFRTFHFCFERPLNKRITLSGNQVIFPTCEDCCCPIMLAFPPNCTKAITVERSILYVEEI